MGYSSYSTDSRSARAVSSGYFSSSRDEIFTQNKKKVIHDSMIPKNAQLREAKDSQEHPLSVPIIVALDVTGSMGSIPHNLIKDGLPKMMSGIIQKGIKDPQVLFLAVGDHEEDKFPLQVGQFEAGDLELDTWLTRTYIEGGGGANAGESYLLAWYYAAYHTSIESFDKRGEKGFIFTIGDEPNLPKLPANVINGIMGTTYQKGFTEQELLDKVKEKYNIFHLQLGSYGLKSWKGLLGQHCIEVGDYENIPSVIAETVISYTNVKVSPVTPYEIDESGEKITSPTFIL